MRYRIGEVSRMLDISAQTLRFLETTGLVTPVKDKTNGYRYYTLSDIDRIMNYKKYRQAGFSLPESVSLLQTGTRPVLVSDLGRKVEEARMEALYQQEKMRKLSHFRTLLELSEQLEGEYCLIERPAACCLYTRQYTEEGISIREAKEFAGSFEALTKEYSFVEHCYRIGKDRRVWAAAGTGAWSDPRPEWGLTIKKYWADLLHLEDLPNVEYEPALPCLFTILTVPEQELFSRKVWEPILSAGKCSAPPAGDVLIIDLARVAENGTQTGIFELWFPVDPDRGKGTLPEDSETVRTLRRIFADPVIEKDGFPEASGCLRLPEGVT